jgi:hypothetical protein
MTKQDRLLRRMRKHARDSGYDVEIGIIPDDRLPKGSVRITFFGMPAHELDVPEPGCEIEVRVEDGSWQGGYRLIDGPSEVPEYPDEQAVWITSEEEWARAAAENRPAGGQPWPADQIREIASGPSGAAS